MKFQLSVVLVLCLSSSIVLVESVTYVDTLIANFLNKEQVIWQKLEEHSNPLPDIQLIVAEDTSDVPKSFLYGTSVNIGSLIFQYNFAEPYNLLKHFNHQIENCYWKENKENRTDLTMQEIDQKYTEVNKLSNDLFSFVSQDLIWQYGVTKMVSKITVLFH